MNAAITLGILGDAAEPRRLTLLELVRAVSAETANDREVVATVLHLLRSGKVRLCGSFRDSCLEDA